MAEWLSVWTTGHITSSVRVRVPSGTKKKKNPSECMRFGCCLPIAVVSQAYPGNAKMCPGFPPPQAALVTAAAGDKGLWVVWCSSDEVRLRHREGNPH